MTDYLEPANSNLSFAQVTRDKQRDLVDDAFGPTICLLQRAGIPGSMIADALFEFLKSTAVPTAGAPDAANMIWYAQLQRFRHELDVQIKIIEAALDGEHD